MADTKITALAAITTVDPAADVLPIVDISDTSMAASGTTKKITTNQILGSGGTATLASATITGNLTLSAGTVNGVGYLNASKVLTAGSALIFDGTNLGVGGTGQLRFATSGGAIGDNTIGTENSFSMMLRCGRGTTSNIELASDKLVFGTATSERYRIASDGVATWSNVGGVAGTAMTLNSTGLGIGTATPAAKLIVRDGTNRNFLVSSDATQLGSAGIAIGGFTDGAAGYAPLSLLASAMQFGISGTTAMTLNASGLGLGTATFGTSAAKVLAIATGTEPTTGPAGTVQLFTSTRSASNTIPAIFTEGSGVTNAAITNTTVTNKIAIKVNGTIYYLLATTSAA